MPNNSHKDNKNLLKKETNVRYVTIASLPHRYFKFVSFNSVNLLLFQQSYVRIASFGRQSTHIPHRKSCNSRLLIFITLQNPVLFFTPAKHAAPARPTNRTIIRKQADVTGF